MTIVVKHQNQNSSKMCQFRKIPFKFFGTVHTKSKLPSTNIQLAKILVYTNSNLFSKFQDTIQTNKLGKIPQIKMELIKRTEHANQKHRCVKNLLIDCNEF